MIPREELARLHFVNTVLDEVTGQDLFLASQILEGLVAATDKSDDLATQLDVLHERLLGRSPQSGFAFCDGGCGTSAGPLFVRAELLAALRRNAPRRKATVMIANLPGMHAKPLKRNRRRASEHADTVSQLREAAARKANPRSLVTLLFV